MNHDTFVKLVLQCQCPLFCLATGASWLVRKLATTKYTDYHVLAIAEFQDENGDWHVAACGIFGLWLISHRKGADVIKAD
jgi:hypothetical protein